MASGKSGCAELTSAMAGGVALNARYHCLAGSGAWPNTALRGATPVALRACPYATKLPIDRGRCSG
jgi:hypothetical protein